jgi:hypothetical protein
MGEKPLEFCDQLTVIAQVNADVRNRGAFQAADVRLAECQVLSFFDLNRFPVTSQVRYC